MAEITPRSRIGNSRMRISNIVEENEPHSLETSIPPPDFLPTPLDLRSPILAGDVPKVQSLCDWIRMNKLPLPLRYMLLAALSGSSVPMLEHIFSLGAKLDVSTDSLPSLAVSTPRPLAFFSCLVNRGWPVGARGLAINLHHGLDVVRLILSRGSRVGFLCLKEAVRHGDVEVAELLLKHLNPRTKIPTAVDYSTNLEDPERWYGPEMNSEEPSFPRIMNEAGFLQIAAHEENLEMVQWLIVKGALVDSVPKRECCCWDVNGSALGYAVAAGKVEAVKLLVKLGADPELRDEEGRTSKELNAIFGRHDTREGIAALLEGGHEGREKE